MTFEEWKWEYSKKPNFKIDKAMNDCWESATEAAKPRWIPIHEQLPKKTAPYVIKVMDRLCPVVKIWSNGWIDIGSQTVTHWMELPE